jgi:O-antigen ligase
MAALVLALPWLIPFAPGPSPAVFPWLSSISIVAGALFFICLTRHPTYDAGGFKASAKVIVVSWIVAGLASAAIGLLQYYGVSGALHPWISHASFGEAYANLRQRNQFASLTNIAFASLVYLSTRYSLIGYRHWTLLLAVCLLMAGNAASSSRTGFVQVLLLCLIYGYWGGIRGIRIRRVLITAVVGYIVATLVLPWFAGLDPSLHGLISRLRAGEKACYGRITLWENVFHLITLQPWTGWGAGELDYAHYMTLYQGLRFCQILDNAHNLPLHLAVELGLPAALLLCGGFVAWVIQRRPWQESDPDRQLAWAVFSVILLHSMLEYPLWYAPFQIAGLCCLSLLWLAPKELSSSENSVRNFGWKRGVLVTMAASVMTAAAYAMWDYHRVSQIYMLPADRDPAYREHTLEKISGTWLFSDQVRFAELSMTPLIRANARWTYETANDLLHYSPEPKVIEKVIESAVMLGLDDEAAAHLARYRAAFPEEYAVWTAVNTRSAMGHGASD